jgi:hypothetical protein
VRGDTIVRQGETTVQQGSVLERPEAGSRLNATNPGHKAIREQLDRILASTHFRNSKRYPNLLQYVVVRTLEGRGAELKERTIGIEVLGREPDYDTSTDPAVRITAGEVRKRLVQYYQEPGHEFEVRIDLAPGSYIPCFRMPAQQPGIVSPDVPSKRKYLAGGVAAAVFLLLVAIFLPRAFHTAVDQFWDPVLNTSNAVLLCVGQRSNLSTPVEPAIEPGPKVVPSLFQFEQMSSQNVALSDLTALSRLAVLVQGKGKSYHIRSETTATLADLRDGPVVLIGAFDNEWTMRLMNQMRFRFEGGNDVFGIRWIADRQNPARRDWAVNFALPYSDVTEDYAIITRVQDPTTGRMVVVAAGLANFGTVAAAEFLADVNSMEDVARKSRNDWKHKNVQIVIATGVINGDTGRPHVLATHFW